MIAAIGDIHGCIKTLDYLINRLISKYQITQFIFLGDYIDRGKNSKDVLYFIAEFKTYHNSIFLKGNHEDMMQDYFYDEKRYDRWIWLENGGKETLNSFSSKFYLKILNGENIKNQFIKQYEKYLNMIKNMSLYYTLKSGETFFLSHAGCLNMNIPPEQHINHVTENEKAIFFPYLWTRNTLTSKIDGYIIIHGHSPTQILNKGNFPFINKKDGKIISVNIDTGCVYGYNLSAIVIDEKIGEFDFETVKCKD